MAVGYEGILITNVHNVLNYDKKFEEATKKTE